MNSKTKQLGEFIAACRHTEGLTQAEVAKNLGVLTQLVSNWERGMQRPALKHLNGLSQILDIDRCLFADRVSASIRESTNKKVDAIYQALGMEEGR